MQLLGSSKQPGGTYLSVTRPAAVTFPGSLTMVVHTFVGFLANKPEYGIESVVAERDKWNLEMQNHRVYSAPVQAQWSHFQRLNDRELLWVSFIQHRFLGLQDFPT